MASGADPKLVAILEARLDKFAEQMNQTGAMADKAVKDIEDKFSKANPKIGEIATGTAIGSFLSNGITGAIKAGISLLGDMIERFKQLEMTARVTGVAMNDVFALQQLGGKAGASIDEVNKGLFQLGEMLNKVGRGDENSLSKLFEANGKSLKDQNGELISTQTALGIVADLVRNARTEFDKIDIARMAGQARTMVPLLEKGSVELSKMQVAASAAAPDLQRLANLAADFDTAWKAAIDRMKAYLVSDLVASIKSFLATTIDEFAKIFEFLDRFGLGAAKTAAQFRAAAAELRLGASVAAAAGNPSSADAGINSPLDRIGESARRGNKQGGGTTTADPNAPITKLPPSSEAAEAGKDAFDRQADSIRKHIAALGADAEAVGKTVAEHERLRAEAALTAAVLKDGKDPKDYADKIKAIGEEAAAAAGKLDKSRRDFAGFNDALKFAGDNLVNTLDGVLGKTKTWADALRDVLATVRKALLNALILGNGPLAGVLGTASPVQGGTGGLLGGLFGGAKASGGPVSGGRAYLVGEQGPELMVPDASGTIVPNSVLHGGGAAGNVSYTIDARGADPAAIERLERALQQNTRAISATNKSIDRRAISAVSQFNQTGVLAA